MAVSEVGVLPHMMPKWLHMHTLTRVTVGAVLAPRSSSLPLLLPRLELRGLRGRAGAHAAPWTLATAFG